MSYWNEAEVVTPPPARHRVWSLGNWWAYRLPRSAQAPGDVPGDLRLLAMSSKHTSLSLLVRGAL